jgi:hypothetical protein
MAVCPNFIFVPSGVNPAAAAAFEGDPDEAATEAVDPASAAAGCELLLEPEPQAANPATRTDTMTAANAELRAGPTPGPPPRIFSPNDIAAP